MASHRKGRISRAAERTPATVIASIRWTFILFYRSQSNTLSALRRRFGAFVTSNRFVSRCIWYISSHYRMRQAMGWLPLSESYAL